MPPAKPKAPIESRGYLELLALSADKSVYATVTSDHRAYTLRIVRRAPPARTVAEFVRKEEMTSLAVAPDGGTAAVGTASQVILVSSKTGRATPAAQIPKGVAALCYSPDGAALAVGDSEGRVRLWSLKGRRVLWEGRPHQGDVWSLAFSADGKILASGSMDGTVRLAEVASGKRIRHLHAHRKSVSSVALSRDGSVVCSIGLDRRVVVSEVKTGRPLLQRIFYFPEIHTASAFTKAGTLVIVSGGFRGVLDVKTGKVVYSSGELK